MFLSALFIWQFVYWVWLLTFEDCKGDLIANAIFLMTFLTIKGYSVISVFLVKSGIYVFKSAQYICQFTSLDFHVIPGGFRCLPGRFPFPLSGKFTPRFHTDKVFKIWHFLRWVDQSTPGYWDRVYSSIEKNEQQLNECIKIFAIF